MQISERARVREPLTAARLHEPDMRPQALINKQKAENR